MGEGQLDLTQTLLALLPVIVGGLLATLGGLAGPPLIHWLTEKSEKRKKREEKFEELIGALYEHAHWLERVRNIRVFGYEDTHPPSPLPKARAIAAVYFPTFVDRIAELENTGRLYEQWMIEASKKRLAGKIEGLNEGFRAAYHPYGEGFMKLIAALQQWATTEFRR